MGFFSKENKVKVIESLYKAGSMTGIYSKKIENDYNEYAEKKIKEGKDYRKSDFMKEKRKEWGKF